MTEAVPWLRRLVAGLSTQRPGFDPGSVHVEFEVDTGIDFFFQSISGFFCQFHSTCAPFLGNIKKLIIFLSIFIARLHNKP
jgi:hypothetical protein